MSKENKIERPPLSEEDLRAATVGDLQPLSSPIHLADPDPGWPVEFQHHAERIRNAIGGAALRIEHVGSTAVPGCWPNRSSTSSW